MIPRNLVRTTPVEQTEQMDRLWTAACELHPGWQYVTLAGPGGILQPDRFPLTGAHWERCQTGAQWADLVRAECLYFNGGVYIDSDVEVHRSFEPLTGLRGFVAWEDDEHICNAVMGFSRYHPALADYLQKAIARLDEGTFASGVGTFTEVMAARDDILVLPPASFYPVHWRQAEHTDWDFIGRNRSPWTYATHRYAASWKKGQQ